MQLSIALVAFLGAAGSMANLHYYAYCFDRSFKGINEENKENNDVTQKACDAYRRRNTGTKQWDTCPDCSTSFRGDVRVCNSPAKHIGGDEWEYYCRQNGASGGKAD